MSEQLWHTQNVIDTLTKALSTVKEQPLLGAIQKAVRMLNLCRQFGYIGSMNDVVRVEPEDTDDRMVPAQELSRMLGAPPMWFTEEVKAGRLPGIVAGKTSMFHLATVKAALSTRAAAEAAKGGGQ